MTNSRAQRFRPARIITVIFSMILFGSVAQAESGSMAPHSVRTYQFSPALASSLALSPQEVTKETPKLHTTLVREARLARVAAAERRSWSKRRAAAQKTPALAPAPGRPSVDAPSVPHSSAD